MIIRGVTDSYDKVGIYWEKNEQNLFKIIKESPQNVYAVSSYSVGMTF